MISLLEQAEFVWPTQAYLPCTEWKGYWCLDTSICESTGPYDTSQRQEKKKAIIDHTHLAGTLSRHYRFGYRA
jgi:hypothetical protein